MMLDASDCSPVALIPLASQRPVVLTISGDASVFACFQCLTSFDDVQLVIGSLHSRSVVRVFQTTIDHLSRDLKLDESGSHLVSAGSNFGQVELWHTGSGLLRQLYQHPAITLGVVISGDGCRVAR